MDLKSNILNNSSILTDLESVKVGDGSNASLKDILNSFSPAIVTPSVGKTIGHRGYYSNAPENTTASFEAACIEGFWGIETDIHNTSDGELVCIHDATIDRTTDGSGHVNNLTYKEIQNCNIDAGSHISDYPGLKVPKFEEYLSICRQYGAIPVIEVKGIKDNNIKYYKKMISTIREYGMEESCMCIGSQTCMSIVRSLSHKIHVQVIVYQATNVTDDLLLQIAALGNSGVDFHNTHIDINMVKKCHELGLLVNCWTVNDSYMIESYRKLGVDFITSNAYALGCNISRMQSRTDSSLKTKDNKVAGAINEVNSKANKAIKQLNGLSFVSITASDYVALETKDPNTVYLVTD